MRVLLVDDEPNMLIVLEDILLSEGHEVCTADDGNVGLQKLREFKPDVVVTDLRMKMVDGIALTSQIAQKYDNIPVVVLTAYGEVETAVKAMQAGAVDYLQKPVKPEDFLSAIRRAVKSRMRSIEREYLRDEVQGRLGFSEFVGESKAASEVRSFVEMASQSDASTVISGETGVGKELVARLLHRGGKRNDRPFIVVNCAKPSFEWIHRELYGARDGSSVGKLELAHEGTLFLDEVGELPYEAQGTLLNVLEDGLLDSEGKRPHRVDIRFIASTKLKLKELVAAGNFRVDLFHRLNVLSIDLPTLSERRQDISLLANWLLEKHRQKLGSHCSSISKETLRALEGYFWPGNFRELSNVIERALVMSVGEQLQITDLPSDIVGRLGDDAIATNLKERLLEEEKRLILEALEKNSYIQNQAARALGISRSLMNQKIKRFGIKTSGN